MCLDTVTKRYDAPKPETITAYKICILNKGRIEPMIRNVSGGSTTWSAAVPYKLRQWFKAANPWSKKEWLRVSKWTRDYIIGFHVFPTIADARKYAQCSSKRNLIIVPVKVRGVHTEGTQSGAKVLIADEMRFEHGCIKSGVKIARTFRNYIKY